MIQVINSFVQSIGTFSFSDFVHSIALTPPRTLVCTYQPPVAVVALYELASEPLLELAWQTFASAI